MKKNVFIISISVLLLAVLSSAVFAQPGKKKKKKSKTESAQTADSLAAAARADSAKLMAGKAGMADTTADTSAPVPYGLVADSSIQVMDDFTLDSTRPVDGYYKQTTLKGAKPFPIAKQSINNIKKYKRIWRQIDLTDTINKIFCVPDEELMKLLVDAIKTGKLIAYRDDEFKKAMTYNEMIKVFVHSTQVTSTDINGNDSTVMTKTEFNPRVVKKYEIKEDLYFDKVRGKLVTEIISFAPVMPLTTSTGADAGSDTHPFYLNFNQCRKLFAAREVTDLTRDISNMSYDDLFITGNFHSRIIREASPSGLSIKDKYPNEEDQIKEANRIENEIRNYKKYLWKY